MSRRFLNMVLRGYGGLYSLSHMDTWKLFYKSFAVARKKNGNRQGTIMDEDEIRALQHLPDPTFSFQSFRSNHYYLIKGAEFFSPLGESKILFGDGLGQTAVYDTKSLSFRVMPPMNSAKGHMHITLPLPRTEACATSAVACDSDSDISRESSILQRVNGNNGSESLYILDMAPRCRFAFEVLSSSKGWHWRPLPPPPFLDKPEYKPRWDSGVAVDRKKIFISPSSDQENNLGTYCFNMVSQEWTEAGDWVLPFMGKAEYVPELNHWFGVSHCTPYHFCAMSSLDPPKVKRFWSDLCPPKDWSLFSVSLVNLGSGRFCTIKFFDAKDPSYEDGPPRIVAVFTGVEVVRCLDQGGCLGLEMVKHKSLCLADLDIVF